MGGVQARGPQMRARCMRGCRTPFRQIRQGKELRGVIDEYDMR